MAERTVRKRRKDSGLSAGALAVIEGDRLPNLHMEDFIGMQGVNKDEDMSESFQGQRTSIGNKPESSVAGRMGGSDTQPGTAEQAEAPSCMSNDGKDGSGVEAAGARTFQLRRGVGPRI